MNAFTYTVGIDWGNEENRVCVEDADGRIVGDRTYKHSGEGMAALLTWLVSLCRGNLSLLGVALELPRGSLVEMLVERGIAVFFLNPKQVDRFRDRHSVAGAKDDRRDAFVLADALRTDLDKFTRCRLDHPLIIELRSVERAEDEVQQEFRRAANQLWAELQRFYPQLLTLCPAADEEWIWALWERYPTPALAQNAKHGPVERVLHEYRIRRVTSEEVCAALKAPPLPVAPGVTEAARSHIELLVPRLRLLSLQLRTCKRQLETLLGQLSADSRDGPAVSIPVMLSLPGIGLKTASVLLVEATQLLEDRDLEGLRAKTGVAPVTRQSGKSKSVSMRRACHAALRNALYHMARVASQNDPACHNYYATLRERGHSHGRALRSLADRQLRILCAMLESGTPYQTPARLQNAA